MSRLPSLVPGLPSEVHDSQQAFRALLDALARPGRIRCIGPALSGVALGGALARLLLTLSDDETPVWWQSPDDTLQQWLRFHTGAPLASQPDSASFAVFTNCHEPLTLSDFSSGSAAAPEFSATLLIELPSLENGPSTVWRGPGIEGAQQVTLQGLPDDFWTQWQTNHAAFPQGVDIVFSCGDYAIGLPRTTRVHPVPGV